MCAYGFVDLRLFETGVALLNCLKEMFSFLYKHNFKLINYSMAILVSICLRFHGRVKWWLSQTHNLLIKNS
jgi:hypothetical protein